LRTIAFAYRDYQNEEWEYLKDANNRFLKETDRHVLESELTFLVGFGLNDDLRDGVTDVIGKLFRGGVNVRMISGDNIETATYVAK